VPEPGQRAVEEFEVTEERVRQFGDASGDHNPVHFDEAYARGTPFGGRIAHGLLTASFVSAVLGNMLPGPGTIYLSQTLSFRGPVPLGSTVRVEVEVIEHDAARSRTTLATRAYIGDALVLDGEARVISPRDA
jgi:3-hydroxybutyryl-CoA dehydratase